MRWKKKMVLLLTLLMIGVMVPAWAATSTTTGEPAEESYENLRLTDTQKEQIKPIMEQRAQQISQVMHDSSLTIDEKWAKADEIRSQSRAAVDQYLSPEQKAKADPIRTENDMQRSNVRDEQRKVNADNQQLKNDRQQLHNDRQAENKEAAAEDKDKVHEDRQQRANDRIDRHQVRQQGKEDRRNRRQANRG